MKRVYTFIVTLILAQYTFAQWPANYGGVMLQAFYWDSFEDTNWQNLTSKAEEYSKYFDLLWVPNSGNCVSANSMGYLPVYWFDHRSSFGGRERYLTEMIDKYNSLGTKLIMDVVINHKAPEGKNGSYIDFANETRVGPVTGETYTVEWSGADICQNDDGGYVASLGFPVTGAYDTGDDFSGARDLDHTSANVQKNCITYMNFLLKELKYSGYRLDMVKGYSAEFTKIYNEATKPEFCVGEYWDGYGAITNWINGTGRTSAAFDFPLKYALKEAFSGNWSKLSTDKGMAGDPNYARYAVTFIDNHDTYENESRHTVNILGANGFILAMPGTPCIFLKHWKRYPIGIGNMILARKACGITNESPIVEQQEVSGGYVIKTQGSKGTVLFICGFPSYDTTGFHCICSGTDFAYFVSDNVNVEGLTEGSDDDDPTSKVTVYVNSTSTEAPYIYAWNDGGAQPVGGWPGRQMTETATTEDGKSWWKYTFSINPVNVIFNNGAEVDLVQTADIKGLTHDSYFTFDPSNTDKETNYTDVTSQYYTPEPVELPSCVKPIEGHLYVYFQANKDYDTPYIWVWGENDKNFCTNTTWPGDKMKWVGTDGTGHAIWLWDAGAIAEGDPMPTGLLFSNNGDPQSADLPFKNGGYYDIRGWLADVATGIDAVTIDGSDSCTPIYNLQGQRVNGNYRGLIIQNGRKVVNR